MGGRGEGKAARGSVMWTLKPPTILRSPGAAEEAGAKASLQGMRSLGGGVSRQERKEPGAAAFLSSISEILGSRRAAWNSTRDEGIRGLFQRLITPAIITAF